MKEEQYKLLKFLHLCRIIEHLFDVPILILLWWLGYFSGFYVFIAVMSLSWYVNGKYGSDHLLWMLEESAREEIKSITNFKEK